MYDSPSTLQDICLDAICENVPSVFDMYYVRVKAGNADESPRYEKRYKFKDDEMFLYNELSESLFHKLVEKNMLCDATIGIFNETNTRLKRVRIRNPHKLTYNGLKTLKQHKIEEFECVNLKGVSIAHIIDCLSSWSLDNMTVFNCSRCSFIDVTRFSYMVQVIELKHLRSLNLSHTELNQQSFNMLCEDLLFLEKLDISATHVKDLRPLLKLSDKLVNLSVSDLKSINQNAGEIVKMRALRHLDVSVINERFDVLSTEENVVKVILEHPDHLNELVSFDVSGWKCLISKSSLVAFLDGHPKLKYLGIIANVVAFDTLFTVPDHRHFQPELAVAGLANEDQLKVALRHHYDKAFFVQKSLYHLFQLTSSFTKVRHDFLGLVLAALREHPQKFGVQVAATACLYNLCRGEFGKAIHPSVLAEGVRLILIAMENFPDEYQLQKNSLLNLCSDRILQEVNFDRFRCAKLVMDSLCAFDETNMNRMAVAICSILAAKVSTAETSELGARPVYMRKLLAMVQSRVDSKQGDITLKFTLSALWNLTDESAATCLVFLGQGGALLFLNVLRTFKGDSAIETKVLGLLNNVAEVEPLRADMMVDDLVAELHSLLTSEHVDVSYFAAGIVAHLASDGDAAWRVARHDRARMLAVLEEAVRGWGVPECEMVAYRSFKPFFPLLRREMDYQVQLWAVWAIFHVCSKNPLRYCSMLVEEKGNLLLQDLLADSHPSIKKLSSLILEILETNYADECGANHANVQL